LTATTQVEVFFLAQSPPFGGWQPWTVLLVAGIPLAVLVWEVRRGANAVKTALPLAARTSPLASLPQERGVV
jgi:hypothetical protein